CSMFNGHMSFECVFFTGAGIQTAMKASMKPITEVESCDQQRCVPSLAKEGWLRHQERWRAASTSGADGVVGLVRRIVLEMTQRPRPRLSKGRVHFLDSAATPPLPRRGRSLVQGFRQMTKPGERK